MTDPTGQVSAAIEIVNNITERKKLEEQYRQAKMEAVACSSRRVARFQQFADHHGYSHLLSLVAAGDPLALSPTDLSAADRAASLHSEPHGLRPQAGRRPVPVDLSGVVRGILELLNRLIREDVELVTQFSPSPAPSSRTRADRSRS
jgi:hypothetical protein